jgi:hypothetical protein
VADPTGVPGGLEQSGDATLKSDTGRTARRVVTGHDEDGCAVILFDGHPPKTLFVPASPAELFELWNTNAAPVPIHAAEREPTERPIQLSPRSLGTVFRFTDFHPSVLHAGMDIDRRLAATSFAAVGEAGYSTWKSGAAHPLMHRTATVDYGIVIEGEIYLVLDRSETLLRAGDVVIQRGTNHAWDNRGSTICRMAFVLIDGALTPELAALLDKAV